jgi:hypothetical protein
MKSSQLFVALLVAGLVMSALPSSASCSNATLNGGYGFLITGANSSGPAAIVGLLTANGKGALTGSETISVDGVITSSVALTGTYSVKSTCTGSATITPTGFPTAKYNITVVSSGKQIDMVDSDSGVTEYGYALALGKSTCTAAAINGAFGFQGGGVTSSLAPIAFSGQAILDGVSVVTGTETYTEDGTVSNEPLSGTYTVNSNCTGTITLTFTHSTSTINFVIVDGDQSALEISTNSGNIVTTTAAKQ